MPDNRKTEKTTAGRPAGAASKSAAARRRKKRSRRMLSILLTVLCLIVIFFICLMLAEHAKQAETAQTEAETEVSGESAQNGDTAALSGETVLSGMPPNEYDLDAFSADGQYIRYSAAETWTGIDVSEHQGSIDWQAVADQGIDFAMIRVGYRGYSAGEISADPLADANLAGAAEAGIAVGVYFFSQAITMDEAIEEAQFVLDAIADYDVTWPVAFDWEPIDGEARTDEVDQTTLTECALAFCQTVEAAGYTAAVYFNQTYGYQGYNLPQLLDYAFWLAQYDETPSFLFHFDMWQYSSTAYLDGIEGAVDLNLSFVNFAQAE